MKGLLLKKVYLLITFSVLAYFAFSQNPTQTIRGTVTDAITGEPIIGATIVILDTDPVIGTNSDIEGKFRVSALPVGYYDIKVDLLGYQSVTLSQLLLESGKELVLDIKLDESTATLQEVVLIGRRVETAPNVVSVNTISQEEVIRFPGTFYDPSRLAMTFAGVASTDDQANNIAIRGNSPNGLSWRLEGVEIVNPNHLSNAGTISDRPTQNGGGVNILSAQLLGTSHFLTGAFPSNYGNSLSGVMDMRFRPGNNERYEFTAQAGLIGFDFAAEGPISKESDASFLVNYRYSFIGLLTGLGVEVSDEDIRFQDLAFNVFVPTKKAGRFIIFGMGGKSQNIFEANADSTIWEVQKDRFNISFENDMYAVGLSHQIPLNHRTSWKTSLVFSNRNTTRYASRLDENLEAIPYSTDRINQSKLAFMTQVEHKLGQGSSLRIGTFSTYFSDQNFSTQTFSDERVNGNLEGVLLQPFVNYQQKFISDRLTANLGLHFQHFTFDQAQSIEPRFSLSFSVNKNQKLNLAYGLHSQLQPSALYLSDAPARNYESLDFTKAHHFVLGYEHKINNSTSIKTELYYQSLFDIPISTDPGSSFSAINLLEGFVVEDLTNTGTAKNYGIELGLQKRFSDDFFFLINGSLFDSKYTGADGIERNTRFNSRYIFNGTAGKEFRWNKRGKNKVFGLNARLAYYGGFWETPIDQAASVDAGETVFIDSEAFSVQQPDFFKIDLRLYWKNNKAKYSSTVSLDIQNASNQQNIAFSYYDPQQGEVIVKNQLGLIPVLSYRAEF